MRLITLIIAWSFVPVLAFGQGIQQSHMSNHLPDTFIEFQGILERDLVSYFQKHLGKPITINYDLLREVPTQFGASYPKFYAWVSVQLSGKVVKSGVVRVAAVDKVRIEVTDFVSLK